MSIKSQNTDTKCVHAGLEPEKITGAIMPPIFQTSTYAQKGPGKHTGYEYSRTQNPTRKALESCLQELEIASYACAFASGCAAANTVLMGLKPGDEIVAMDDLYGGTSRLFNKIFANFGLKFKFCDLSDINQINEAITSNTRLVWVETPSNPLLKITPIKALVQRANDCGAEVLVDNTFATPIWQNPLDLGAHLVLHSTTKYIGGHCDVLGGALLTNSEAWQEKISFLSNSIGAVPAPFDCFLTLRGIRTLDLRMKKHQENAFMVAEFLESHPKVEKVYFPGLKSHKQHHLVNEQMRGVPGIISFCMKEGEEKALKVCERTQVFICAESLGGVESLIEHPGVMTHASVSLAHREKLGIQNNLLRISVGIENPNDLIKDLINAFE